MRVYPNGAAVSFENGAGEIETEPSAFYTAGVLAGGLETVEDVGDSGAGDAGALILHADDDVLGAHLAADEDLAAIGSILDRIGEQVEQNLTDALLIGQDDRKARGEIQGELVFIRLGAEAFHQAFCQTGR